jgi:GTP cyclohydrolase II
MENDDDPSMTIAATTSSLLPTKHGTFRMHAFRRAGGQEHLALAMGEFDGSAPVLARIHSECLTGEALGSLRCDCGEQLEQALAAIADEGRGVLVYLRQEGRGIGLFNKVRAYRLQDQGADTVEANVRLGFPADGRDYAAAVEIFEWLGINRVKLMTNNPQKIRALVEAGFDVVERVEIAAQPQPTNQAYLATKRQRMGHLPARPRLRALK